MRLYLLTAAALLALALSPGKRTDSPPRVDPEARALDLALEIQALRTLYLLNFTTEQVKKLQGIAKKVAEPDRDRDKPRITDEYRRVLVGLREALAANNEDKVENLEDRLAELTDSENPELDDAVSVTAVARRHVVEVFRLLRPKQLASYFGSIAEEVADPQERLAAAVEQVHVDKNDDWEDVRDDLADDLGWLLGGLNAERSKAVRGQITELLTKAHNLNDDEFGKQKADLEKAARAVGADATSMEVLRHAVERALAKLLANPRLGPALEARLRAAP
jgi:hypothetical protein